MLQGVREALSYELLLHSFCPVKLNSLENEVYTSILGHLMIIVNMSIKVYKQGKLMLKTCRMTIMAFDQHKSN